MKGPKDEERTAIEEVALHHEGDEVEYKLDASYLAVRGNPYVFVFDTELKSEQLGTELQLIVPRSSHTSERRDDTVNVDAQRTRLITVPLSASELLLHRGEE